MKLAVSTWNYVKARGDSARLADALAEIRSAGLGAELWLGWTSEPGCFRREAWPGLKAACRGFPALSAHSGAIHSFELAGVLEEIELCGAIGADPLVVHPRSLGIQTGTWDAVWGGRLAAADLDRISKILERAAAAGVRLALENGSYDVLAAVLEAFRDHPCASSLGVCIDAGHANMHRDLYESPASFFVESFREKLIHLHLADNSGGADEHRLPGQGSVDWPRFLAAAPGFAGMGVLELAVPEPAEGARRAVEFLRGLGT